MIVAISKPKGPTSHDIVARVRRITGIKRVGHGGTLDPLASGVLVVAIERKDTKKLGAAVAAQKEYEAEIRFDATSTTDDAEGILTPMDAPEPTEQEFRTVLERFVGTVEQMPPQYSALKVRGVRAYALARKGKVADLQPRMVRIDAIELIDFAWPTARIRVTCGTGVYIRALAKDIGAALGAGGYLTALIRTRVGNFTLKEAMTLEDFERFWQTHGHEV